MGQLIFEKHVNAPIERVFALMSDFANAPQRAKAIKKIEMLTEGPVGLGTKFKETRVMFGKEATETMEVTSFDPPRSYNLSAFSCGTQYESTFQFEPKGNGTNVKMIFTFTPKSFFAKLMSPLFKMMSGVMRKCVTQDLDDLAKAAEGTTMAGV